jgi:hypothetical protein
MKKLLIALFILSGCAQLPVSPQELKPSPTRASGIATQEAILPNTSYDQILKRMQDYSAKCLRITREVSCGRGCSNSIQYTPTILMEKNKLILYLQKKGGTGNIGAMPKDGVYLLMAESLTNGKTQQITVHGFDTVSVGFTTQATIDWLSDRKKECPRL